MMTDINSTELKSQRRDKIYRNREYIILHKIKNYQLHGKSFFLKRRSRRVALLYQIVQIKSNVHQAYISVDLNGTILKYINGNRHRNFFLGGDRSWDIATTRGVLFAEMLVEHYVAEPQRHPVTRRLSPDADSQFGLAIKLSLLVYTPYLTGIYLFLISLHALHELYFLWGMSTHLMIPFIWLNRFLIP